MRYAVFVFALVVVEASLIDRAAAQATTVHAERHEHTGGYWYFYEDLSVSVDPAQPNVAILRLRGLVRNRAQLHGARATAIVRIHFTDGSMIEMNAGMNEGNANPAPFCFACTSETASQVQASDAQHQTAGPPLVLRVEWVTFRVDPA